MVAVIDTVPALQALLDYGMTKLSPQNPDLFIDLEGIKLGRHGSISIISIYLRSKKKVYLVDVHKLGSQTFSTTSSSGLHSLKSVLEAPNIPKVIFDIRNDSDALYHHYQISVAGIKDLQLMELARRTGSKAFVSGLAKCIERDARLLPAALIQWKSVKDRGVRLFAPEKGGRYEVFNERPLQPVLVDYCAQDVTLLPTLYDVYDAQLSAFWRGEVQSATRARIRESQSAGYDGQSREKARGPWSDTHGRAASRPLYGGGFLTGASFYDLDEDVQAHFDIPDDDYDYYQESARDCDAWEEDMIKNGSPF